MSDRYPESVRKLNDLLRADLGSNPRYSWRWSEDLMHVMEVLHEDGTPVYVEGRSPAGLAVMMPKTVLRKLLPMHQDQWIVCALIEVNQRDGSIASTGDHAWIPLSSGRSGPVCLPPNEKPTLVFTRAVIDAVRMERKKSGAEMGVEWEAEQIKKEKDRWNRVYDEIRDAGTAFANVPGRRGHVSFPSAEPMVTVN